MVKRVKKIFQVRDFFFFQAKQQTTAKSQDSLFIPLGVSDVTVSRNSSCSGSQEAYIPMG